MIAKLLTAIGHKLLYLLQSIWGKILLACTWIVEFVCGYELAIWSVVVAITLDLIWGVWASIVRGKFAKSELLRETITKMTAYMSGLLMFILAEKNLPGDSFFIVSIIATVMVCTELLSMSANILIVNPKIVFFKLLRPALKGEIANKLHVPEDKVDEILDNRDSNHGTE
jgi:hypothetical protein